MDLFSRGDKQDVIKELSRYKIGGVDELEYMDLCVLLAVASHHDTYQDPIVMESIIDYIRECDLFSQTYFDECGTNEVGGSVNVLVKNGLLIEHDEQYAIPFRMMKELYVHELKQQVTGIHALEKFDDIYAGVLLTLARDTMRLGQSDISEYLKGMGIIADEGRLIGVLEEFIKDGIIKGGIGSDSFCINPDYLRKEQNPDQGDLFPELKEKG